MANILEINRPNNTIALGTTGTITSIGFKHTAGSQASPIDVTNTRQHGIELHYSGNNYNVTGIRSRAQLVTTDTPASAQGAVLQAANNDGINAGVLNGALIEAIGKSSANAATISTMRGVLIGAEWGAFDTITALNTLHVRTHSLNNAGAGSFGTGYGIYLENEAVGGNGQALDAGIYFKGTNLSAGNKAFTYGIDFSGATYGTADIKLSSANILSDIWLGQNSNTFLGIGVAGGGGLTHSSGTEGYFNTFVGNGVAVDITSGYINTGVGGDVLKNITTGYRNAAFGDNTLSALTTGFKNTALGQNAGKTLITGDSCVFVGYGAGYYETASDKLFIDNALRANEADGRVKALIYGVFASTVAGQSLTVNGLISGTYGAKLGDGGTTNYTEHGTDGTQTFHGTARIDWTKITANGVTLADGPPTSTDTVSDLQDAHDGDTYTVHEIAAIAGQNLVVDFTGVTAFNWVQILARTEDQPASHVLTVQLEITPFNGSAWHTYHVMKDQAANQNMENYSFFVPDDSAYINSGVVKVRFVHEMNGNANDHWVFDNVALYQ